jgi:alanyl-tRNA synthetase
LVRVFLEEKGFRFEEEDFNARFDAALQALQQQSGIGKTERKSQVSPMYSEILEKVGPSTFRGYEATYVGDAKVVAILDGDKPVNEIAEGKRGSVVLDQTPFYAESGGQVGDTGVLVNTANGSDRSSSASVADTYSPVAGLIVHKVTVDKGTLKVGDIIDAKVDAEKRDATRRNHTATHLVHAALKEVLGTHVKQAGSVVAPNYLRFDFTHYQPMTAAEMAEVEYLVNRYILKNEPVTTDMMALEDAMRSGAVAMFGEKYGGEVRVLSVGSGEFSKELCGGTHVRATGDIGAFKITSDEAIASGVRRIRAITGFDALDRFREDELLIERSLHGLNTQRDNLPNAIAKLQTELKRVRKEMDELKLKIALSSGEGSVVSGQSANGDETREINGVKVLGKVVEGLDANGTRQLSDTLLARLKSGVVVLGRRDDGKVGIIVRVSDDLTNKVKAGDVIREIAPIVGGRGGGKADMAEGGGTEPEKLPEAIEASYLVIEKMLT